MGLIETYGVMVKLFPALVVVMVALCGCGTTHHVTTATSRPEWTTASVVGLKIMLEDPIRYQSMRFTREGSVMLTFGRKNGPIASPIYYWQIDSISGRLRIADYDKKIYEELTLISRDSRKIVTRRRSGEVVTYRILDN